MNRRDMMVQVAKETIDVSKKGMYQIGNRFYRFDTKNDTELFRRVEDIIPDVKAQNKKYEDTKIDLRSEGTVDAIFRLSKGVQKNYSLGVLNFASAYNPGGGFEMGAIAQEECLAYCSDLYKKQIDGGLEYYEINRAHKNPLYTDTMFMSNVTFFRNSNYSFVPNPVMCTVLTCPAVNIGAIRDRSEKSLSNAKSIMKNRMRKILYLFAYYGCTDIVLGAFGCGVFGNDPNDVAQFWFDLLNTEGLKVYFNSITFSILDKSDRNSNIDIFKKYFQI